MNVSFNAPSAQAMNHSVIPKAIKRGFWDIVYQILAIGQYHSQKVIMENALVTGRLAHCLRPDNPRGRYLANKTSRRAASKPDTSDLPAAMSGIHHCTSETTLSCPCGRYIHTASMGRDD
jgi:hypothetical protein